MNEVPAAGQSDHDWTVETANRLHEIGHKASRGERLDDSDAAMISFCAGLLIGSTHALERERRAREELNTVLRKALKR